MSLENTNVRKQVKTLNYFNGGSLNIKQMNNQGSKN